MPTDFVASRDNIQFLRQISSDISHFTLHHLQREKKSHAFVLNAKTFIYFYREQTLIAVFKILASIILSQNF